MLLRSFLSRTRRKQKVGNKGPSAVSIPVGSQALQRPQLRVPFRDGHPEPALSIFTKALTWCQAASFGFQPSIFLVQARLDQCLCA